MPSTAEADTMEQAESTMSGLASECDVASHESADEWMECIQNLRESGAIEQADREYEAFLLAYPLE
jgi:hypothetical protein